MSTIELDAKGGRKIGLYLPFKSILGQQVDYVYLNPISWDMTLRWQERKFKRSIDLLVEVSNLTEATLRGLMYPDVDRVLTQFFQMLPPEIINDITSGNAPLFASSEQSLNVEGPERPEDWGPNYPSPATPPVSPPRPEEVGGFDMEH
jgi:hypothetical protein